MPFESAVPIPVCVFAKPPVPGKVKTRLIPLLGGEGAALVAAAMLRVAWQKMTSCPRVRPVLAAAEPGDFGIDLTSRDVWLQGDGDLGMRMERILQRGLQEAAAAVAVGADIPFLSCEHIQSAIRALGDHDAVIGPCEDGGFYLLAVRRCPSGLLANLPWSSPDTARATRSRLEQNGFAVAVIDSLFDVDTPEDLDRLGWT